jgi:hypothetical protein
MKYLLVLYELWTCKQCHAGPTPISYPDVYSIGYTNLWQGLGIGHWTRPKDSTALYSYHPMSPYGKGPYGARTLKLIDIIDTKISPRYDLYLPHKNDTKKIDISRYIWVIFKGLLG